MKYIIVLLFLITSSVCQSQELMVSEPLHDIPFEIVQSSDMIKDANGIPCAIVKVQLPIENVCFEGNIVKSVFKVNEYWLFITAGTKKFRVKCPGVHQLDIDITDLTASGLKSNQCYALKLVRSGNSPDIAPIQNDVTIKEYFVEDFVTKAFGVIPINNLLKDSKTTFETVKAYGLNPRLEAHGDIYVFMTKTPEKCKGFNAIKMQCKVEGCDIIPEQTSMGYEPSKYDDGRVTYFFSWPHSDNMDKRKFGKEQSVKFAKFLLQALIDAGYQMEGAYNDANCITELGEITLVCNDNYGQCWVGLYLNSHYKAQYKY